MENFTFRVNANLKDAFIKAAKDRDSDASKELRRFMRKYVNPEK